MAPTLWLLGWMLASSQTPRPAPTSPPPPPPQVGVGATRGSDWVISPRLSRSQELVYRGTFAEQAVGPRVQFDRSYKIESRLFVLDTPPRGLDVAVLTSVHGLGAREGKAPATSARLERIAVDLQGKVTADPAPTAVPLDGPPTVEWGCFLEVPAGRARVGQNWNEAEANRPSRTWTVLGTEVVNTTTCLKLQGAQQSDDWDRPRADRTAWRRTDTVWLIPRTGVASRVERRIEQREPAHREPTLISTLRMDQESSLQYPGPLSEDRRQEILQALSFRASAAPLLPVAQRNERPVTVLLRKIDYHLETNPPTPYRPGVVDVRRSLEAARRGEAVILPVSGTVEVPAPRAAVVGQLAPEFSASQFTGAEAGRLSSWKGKPTLLVFYHPGSRTAPDVLRFAQGLHTSHGKSMHVVALSVSDEAKEVLQQRSDLKCTYPVYFGGGLRTLYKVESTPKLVVLDAAGVIRADYLGWGQETAGEVLTELRSCWPR